MMLKLQIIRNSFSQSGVYTVALAISSAFTLRSRNTTSLTSSTICGMVTRFSGERHPSSLRLNLTENRDYERNIVTQHLLHIRQNLSLLLVYDVDEKYSVRISSGSHMPEIILTCIDLSDKIKI